MPEPTSILSTFILFGSGITNLKRRK
ncbi:PEP-CTERM sorting domain-containing protein [Gloeocapsa sp. PCC 73106]